MKSRLYVRLPEDDQGFAGRLEESMKAEPGTYGIPDNYAFNTTVAGANFVVEVNGPDSDGTKGPISAVKAIGQVLMARDIECGRYEWSPFVQPEETIEPMTEVINISPPQPGTTLVQAIFDYMRANPDRSVVIADLVRAHIGRRTTLYNAMARLVAADFVTKRKVGGSAQYSLTSKGRTSEPIVSFSSAERQKALSSWGRSKASPALKQILQVLLSANEFLSAIHVANTTGLNYDTVYVIFQRGLAHEHLIDWRRGNCLWVKLSSKGRVAAQEICSGS